MKLSLRTPCVKILSALLLVAALFLASLAPCSVQAAPAASSIKGLKVSVLGDSISTYEGAIKKIYYPQYPCGDVTNVSQTWWMNVINQTGAVYCANSSSAGSRAVGDSLGEDVRCSAKFSRIADLNGANGSPDVIFVLLGCNDMTTNTPIGTYKKGQAPAAEGPITTYMAAYDNILTKLQASNPKARIVCLTCVPRVTTRGGKRVGFINKNGQSIADYNNAIKTVAAGHGLQVIDLYARSGLTDANMDRFSVDGVHPNKAGMQLIADCIVKELK